MSPSPNLPSSVGGAETAMFDFTARRPHCAVIVYWATTVHPE